MRYKKKTIIEIYNNDLTAMEGVTEVPFKFEYDSSSGKYGYRDGADTFRPFNDGGGDDRVLLWTNPNPTSAFAAQWVPVDVTSYDYIIIKVLSTTNTSLNPYTKEYIVELNCKRSSNNTDAICIGTAYAPDNNANGNFRYVRIDPTYGIYFWGGTSTYQYQSANTIAIPLEIYGCNRVVPSGEITGTISQIYVGGKSSASTSFSNAEPNREIISVGCGDTVSISASGATLLNSTSYSAIYKITSTSGSIYITNSHSAAVNGTVTRTKIS